ncbi:hypothetical protein RD792_017277 [Penstemon davidsonii]|uniref:Uncharacterized protein n=1 Tax=Penstemon davidsonii TaxID=160366 RepID=A0ABR0CLZ3_9LAMI|nr:hypothetical protein RD792_017277 [Penstemon davidsonii]
MATAYAAIVSLIHLIDEQIPIYIARRPTIFSKKQLEEIKYLKEKACFIQDHLESHSHKDRGSNEAQDLDRRIVDASYAASDIIESHIVNDIMDQEKETAFQSCVEAILHVSEVVQNVIQDVDYIVKEMLEIEDLHPNNLTPVDHS